LKKRGTFNTRSNTTIGKTMQQPDVLATNAM